MEEEIWGNASFSAVVGAISGAVFGGLVSFFVWLVTHKQARVSAAFDAAELVLEELEFDAKEYWRRSGRQSEAEARIKQQLERLDSRLNKVVRIKKSDDIKKKLERILDELMDEVTGGDFESASKKKELGRVQRIKSKCIELKNEFE